MKRFRWRLLRAVSCVLTFVLIAGPISEGAALSAAATPSASSAVNATDTVAPPSVETSPTIVRELEEERTENSRQLLLSDGTIRAEYFGRPIHYRDPATGTFKQADETLVPANTGGRRIAMNKANSFTLELPEDLSDGPVSIVTEKGSVSLRPVWTGRPAQARVPRGKIPTQAESKVERAYPDAFEGASLEYESRTDGLKETIVVAERSPENVYGFELTLTDLSPRLEEDGSISLLASGEVTATITMPPPCMWDSAEGDEGAAFSDAVRYELSGSAPTWRLDVVADREWLDDPERVYPVLIDPGVITTTATPADTYVSSKSENQNTNFSGSNLVWVRDNSGGGGWTEYGLIATGAALRNDLAAKKSNGYQVVGGRLRLYRYSIATPGSVWPTRVTSSFSVSTVTWNHQRPTATSIPGASAVPIGSGWHTFEVTEAFRHWQDNGTSVCAIRLSTGSNGHMSFESVDYNNRVPVYQVDYAPVPNVSLVSPSNVAVTTVPKAKWTYSEALGNPQVQYQVQVALSPGGTPVASSSVNSSVTEVDLPVPSAGWQPGTTYHVRVRAASSPSPTTPRLWSAWTPARSFTPLLPEQLEGVDTVVASSDWFTETDTTGDGMPDVPNDSPDEGRGSVTLSWDAVPGATGYRVYLSDGNAFREVASTSNDSWTSAGAGIFPSDTAISALSQGTTSNPFLNGTGLDLRDDPRPLYAKTAGTAMNDMSAYAFKVVPYNVYGAPALADAVETLVTLDDRTIGINDVVRHATTELGEFADHSVEAVFDTESMRASVTDLDIASWGPPARLSRIYDSGSIAPGLFGPGWRFNFEQSVEDAGGVATFIDEAGDAYRFVLRDGVYHGPSGFDGELTRVFVGAELGYRLVFRGGDSLTFDGAGALRSDSDSNGNTVLYDRAVPGELSIWAANGQRILVTFSGSSVASASYATSAGTRQVTYGATTYPSYGTARNVCTYYPGTAETRTVTYDYSITSVPGEYYLTGLSVAEVPNAAWSFEAWPRPERWYANGFQTGLVEWEGADSATVVRLGAPWTETYEQYQWNPTGTLARSSNPRYADDPAAWRTYAYSPDGDITREVDPLGGARTWTYDARGNVTSETDEEGRRTSYAYGTSGGALDRVIEEVAPSGSTTYRVYDAAGNMTEEETVLNAAGDRARTEWSYDSSGRTTREERAISSTEAAVTTYGSFAPCGEPQTVSHLAVALSPGADPVTITEQTSFDAFGNVLTRADGTGTVTETNTYSAAGRLVRSEDAAGTAQVSVYDELGRLTESYRQAAGQVIDRAINTYNGFGHLIREDYYTNGTVAITVSHTTDARGRVTKSVHSVSGTTTRRYDAAGNVTAEWAPDIELAKHGKDAHLISATRSKYDALGRVEKTIAPGNPDEKAETTEYSPAGDVLRTTAADGEWVSYAYDASGNRVSETRPVEGGDEVTDTSAHDLAGRLISSVKAVGTEEEATTTFTYDLLGRQVSAQLGEPSDKTYNVLGWVLAEKDFDGIVTERVHDAAGRVTQESLKADANASPKTTTTAYDGCGRVLSSTDPAGRTVTYAYDGFGRIVTEAHTAAGGGQLKHIATTYDTLLRPVQVVQTPANVTTIYSYATAANTVSVATITHAGITTTITYDQHGREESRAVTGPGVNLSGAVGARDAEGRRTAWSVGSQAASAGYDAAGKLTEQSAPGISATYTYDEETARKTAEGVTVAGAMSASAYTYTDTGRLAGALTDTTQRTYALDERGNLENATTAGALTTFAVDGNDRLTSSVTGGVTTTYLNDDLGRRTSQTTSGVTTSYAYDDASRLTSWTRGTNHAAYTYDGYGQRTRAVLTQGSTTTTTDYTYDGITLLSLEAVRGSVTWNVNYLYDEDGRPYAGVYRSGATTRTFLIATTDRGDVVALTNTAGAVFARYTYDPYGRVLTATSNGVTDISSTLASHIRDRQVLRYAGYAYDAHSATYYLSQRHYDPATMRFLTKDPARDDGEESAYQYCAGDPVGKVDPTGLWAEKHIYSVNSNSFRVRIRWPFRTKAYCSAFAANLIWRKGNRRRWSYLGMGQQRIAVELYAHAVAYYSAGALSRLGIRSNRVISTKQRGSEAHVNNNEGRLRVILFYTIWARVPG